MSQPQSVTEILSVINDPTKHRADVVPLYREMLLVTVAVSTRDRDQSLASGEYWIEINGAILRRWSSSALEWIKGMAWKGLVAR